MLVSNDEYVFFLIVFYHFYYDVSMHFKVSTANPKIHDKFLTKKGEDLTRYISIERLRDHQMYLYCVVNFERI